jgi:hypothetical protein
MNELLVVVCVVIGIALVTWLAFPVTAFPVTEHFALAPTTSRDYTQGLYDVRVQLGSILGTLRQVAFNSANIEKDRVTARRLRDDVDRLFMSTYPIKPENRSKLDRLQFDDSGKLLVCDTDGSNCYTLGPVIPSATDGAAETTSTGAETTSTGAGAGAETTATGAETTSTGAETTV